MNKGNKQIALFLLAISVVTTFPVYSAQGGAENTVLAQQNCAWYKKRSIQIVAAVTLCSMASYVLAVCMGKVSSSKALWTLLTTPLLAHNNNDVKSGNSELNTSVNVTGSNSIKPDDSNNKEDETRKMPVRSYRVGPDEMSKKSFKDLVKDWFRKL